MTIMSASSIETRPEHAASDLAAKLSGIRARLVVFFASSHFEIGALGRALTQQFPQAEVIGCTTAGEITSGHMLKHSVVAMALASEAVEDACVGVVKDLKTVDNLPQVFASFEAHTGQQMLDLDIRKYVGIILVDGLSAAEERLMESIGDRTNVIFVGGSAGDDGAFKRTYVFAQGAAHTDAAVLALLKPSIDFDILKTQSFCRTHKSLVATRVNEAERMVFEFDGEPATEAYAKILGVTVAEAEQKLLLHPLGLMIDNEPFVRSPAQFLGTAMRFYCAIREGMKLELLEATNIVEDTRKALQAKQAELGHIRGLINFHCMGRTAQLTQQGQTEAYGKIFADIPTIGFSTYGEEYLGHMNQTSTMLLFH